jgi:putative transposase
MPEYRRLYVPGGTVFLTLVTYRRIPLFDSAAQVDLLRTATAAVRSEWPFDVVGVVVLPDHLHFLWALPPGDADYSKRVGRLKALFTKSIRGPDHRDRDVSTSRRRHREADVWQRRFWDHGIRDDGDLIRHLDYIHYNPVRHGYVACPHAWPYSSFGHWVRAGEYEPEWGCCCNGRVARVPDFSKIAERVGE